MKAQHFRGKYRSIFREKFRASKKIFRANFALQTCQPKKVWSSNLRTLEGVGALREGVFLHSRYLQKL